MRESALKRLLEQSGWQGAESRPLAGDASLRRYIRLLQRGGTSCILMDAPPENCGPQDPFISAAGHLAGLGFSAPKIFAADRDAGFILMEDLGDDIFARVAERCPETEAEMYAEAIECLASLHAAQDPGPFPPYTAEIQADLAALPFEWYCRSASGGGTDSSVLDRFLGNMRDLISGLRGPEVFSHRDFHAENLIWLPERSGVRRVGMLDFQDAVRFHPAYDLVSLLEDARRDVSEELRQKCIRLYCDLTGSGEDGLQRDLAVCGAQRNLRIVGVFARLAVRDGKLGYLNLLPRVWGHLQRDLTHPALASVAAVVNTEIPAPTNSVVSALRDASN